MAIITTDNKHYRNIAAAIREKTGDEATYTPEEMPYGIADVYDAGIRHGFESGIKSEYDRFWDSLQQNGNRTCYDRAFCITWSPDMFRPKYDLVVDSANGMFAYFGYEFGAVSLKKLLSDAGVSLILQKPYNFGNMFESSKISEIGELDFSTATNKNRTGVFQNCQALVTIDKLIFPIGQDNYNWFGSCYALENISISGEISGNGLNLQWSTNLTHDSLMSIINALTDKTADTSASWVVTLGTENLAKLTDAEKAIATQKGWTLA